MAIINISVGNFLPITQGNALPAGIIPQIVSQSLIINQEVGCSVKFENTNQPFNVQQTVAVGKILNLDVDSVLNLSQVMGRTYDIEGANALVIAQQAASMNPQEITQGLAITHSVTPSRALASVLTITQVTGLQGIYSPVLAYPMLTITQSISYFKTDAIDIYNITVSDPIDPIPVILTYGSTVLTLKIPELGDGDKIDVKRVQEQTRGGDLIIYRDPIWSITETLKYKFVGLTRTRSQELLRFFANTIGLSIQLRDYQGNTWNGIIITPETDVVCTNDNNCGSYDVEFEFQGEMT